MGGASIRSRSVYARWLREDGAIRCYVPRMATPANGHNAHATGLSADASAQPGPPPLPPAAARGARARRPSSVLYDVAGLAIAVFVVGMVVLGALQTTGTGPRGATRVFAQRVVEARAIVGSEPQRMQDEGPLERRVLGVVRRALTSGRRSADQDRPLPLQPLDLARVAAPEDLPAYRRLLEPLADAPRFVPRLAERLARHGRGACLAAVAVLQELDYADGRDCRRATNLQRFLSLCSGVGGLVVESAGFEPSAREACMFAAIADGWRRVAERFASDDDGYGQLLAVCGAAGGATRR